MPQPSEIIELSSITPVLNLSKTMRFDEKSSKSSSDSDTPYIEPIDYTPIINSVKIELQQEFLNNINLLSEHQKSLIADLNSQISSYKEDFFNTISNLQSKNDEKFKEINKTLHDVELITQQNVYECNSQLNNRKREHNDFNFELKSLNNKIESLNKQHNTFIESIESLSRKVASIVEFCTLGNLLQIQDESDRESIALMGYKDAKLSGLKQKIAKPVVSIEKQCLSCAGQSSVVLNAFKIACLAYAPSNVCFENEKYSRRDLLDVQNKILLKLGAKLEPPVNENKTVRAASTSMKNRRPVSVPSPQPSPHSEFPDAELPRILRKSINL